VTTDRPATQIDQEVRFAVVMYGGVSLAIYMNGISQELFHMVRATVTADDGNLRFADAELTGVQRVYREVARRVGRDAILASEDIGDAPVRTRFVVDVLSGTSAGGINAIFLAKALANGQEMAGLKALWLREGDIAKLINDKQSADWGRPPQEPPLSLLSSERMYAKLVDAFDDMESAGVSTAGGTSGYVDEIDLAVTATDLGGLPIPLRLSDSVVTERRHRHVFRFRYDRGRTGRPWNDFHAGNNAFLAYAARCTSAFPFAFEPMRLAGIDAVLAASARPWHQGLSGSDPKWQRFFPEYGRSDVVERPFADGGYLDNKPFGHAIDALRQRSSHVPVNRKLIYLEPSPESLRSGDHAPPHALANVMAAFTLARYETIHDDLLRVVSHNRLVERMQTLLRGLEEDVAYATLGDYRFDGRFEDAYLDELIAQPGMGVSYGGYHRLKVASVTDEIASIIAAASGLSRESDELLAVRYLVRSWRATRYVRYRESHQGVLPSESAFLVQFDLSYRLRRLDFVLLQIDRMSNLGPETHALLEHVGMPALAGEEVLLFRDALSHLRSALLPVHDRLHALHVRLHAAGTDHPLTAHVDAVVQAAELRPEALRALLEGHDEATRRATAERLLAASETAFEALADRLAEEIAVVTRGAADASSTAFGRPAGDDAARRAIELVSTYYTNFERYDLIMFPALQTTDIGGEFDHVDVLRISPGDATAIVTEGPGRKKLAGTALGNFGAFIDEGWRKNDILWGRLDGAERLIAALVAEPNVRRDLTRRAHEEILVEEFDVGGRAVADALTRTMRAPRGVGSFRDHVAQRFLDRAGEHDAESPGLAHALAESLMQRQEHATLKTVIYDAFKNTYVSDPHPDPQLAVRAMARSTRVIGQIFDEIAGSHNVDRRPGRWIAKLGSVFWGLVEVAVPNSLANLFFRHWLKLLYTFEVFIIVAGLAIGFQEAQRFGVVLLLITVVVHFLVWRLGAWIGGRRSVTRPPPPSSS
jgi:patatin-related protein